MKKILTTTAMICFSLSAFTAPALAAKKGDTDDYDSNYYQEEGSILFKVRGAGMFGKGRLKDLPKATATSPVKVTNFISNGYGIEGSTTVFLAKNIATELSLGLFDFKTSSSSVAAIGANYGNNAQGGKKKNLYAMPLVLTLQYHIAPYGAIRPYVGAGYQYTYLLSKSQQFIMKSGGGYVVQAGVDFALTDDTVISLDVKHYKLESKISFKSSFLNRPNPIAAKVKLDPTVVSLGIGWKF